MQQYFGHNYGTPAHECALWCATPVGRICYSCEEVIEKGDDGWMRQLVDWDKEDGPFKSAMRVSYRPIHRECDLLGIVGHIVGVCPCESDMYDRMTTRELARECLRRWENYEC